MSEPLVSIIVPCYKVEKYLHNCIESILHQSYTNWELILVDDGSPDRSGEICDEYVMKDLRIKIIHKENGGVASARNAAIDMATGEYASFLDGDDFFHPDCLREMVSLMQKRSADIVQCNFIRGNEDRFPVFVDNIIVRDYTPHDIFVADVANIIMCGKLYRTEILKSIKIPEGRYFEDDLVTWRWYYAAKKIVVRSRPYYYYTCNNASTMAHHKKNPNLTFIDAYDERIAFFRKTGERDLEDCSHRQLCKGLFLIYGNPMLVKEQKLVVLPKFRESWKEIKYSPVVLLKLKLIFVTFNLCPTIIAKLISLLR